MGEKGHELNFPDDDTEVHPEKSFNYIGVSYIKTRATWRVQRYSKHENKALYHYNGSYKDKETAARASDTLARKLIAVARKVTSSTFLKMTSKCIQKKHLIILG